MPLCKTYYVNAETGRDSFDGLSEATAFCQPACCQSPDFAARRPSTGWPAAVCLRGNTCT